MRKKHKEAKEEQLLGGMAVFIVIIYLNSDFITLERCFYLIELHCKTHIIICVIYVIPYGMRLMKIQQNVGQCIVPT